MRTLVFNIFLLFMSNITFNILLYPLFTKLTNPNNIKNGDSLPNYIIAMYIIIGILLFLFIKKIKRIKIMCLIKNRISYYDSFSTLYKNTILENKIKILQRRLILEKIKHNNKNLLMKLLT